MTGPTSASIETAARRVSGYVRETPILHVDPGEFDLGFPVTLKLELLQHAGSFKPRGAFNRLLAARERGALPAAGAIAASGGNHGAAVAYAARRLGIAAEIFVPAVTSAAKRARIESFSARLTVAGASYAEALEASRVRAAESGALEVHAYNDADVLAGQGTLALELSRQAPALTHLLVAVGGGGLIGGIAAYFQGKVTIVAVEPEGCPSLHAALAAGRPVPSPAGGIAADALGAREVGQLMFPIAQAHVAASVLVSDEAIQAAQRLLWDRVRLIVEPGGATALAALMSGAWVPPGGACVGVVVCGANADPASFAAP